MPGSHTAPNPTRIKICGITSVEDGVMVAAAGADALGLVFYEPSPRYVDPSLAADIAKAVGPFITVTGLFVNAEAAAIEDVLSKVPLHLLQFHGDESPGFCSGFRRPWIKAMRMKPGLDVETAAKAFGESAGILLDAYRKGVPGGTGESFDWDRVPESINAPVVLAGGLAPHNVAAAIQTVKPYAVDVSGGVEARPGVKDKAKVEAFVHNVRALSKNQAE